METRSEIEVKLSDKVKVFFTTRVDGFSKGDFSSNNLGLHVHDDNETVLKNRLKLEDAVGKEILFMNQTHSDRVLFVGAEHFVSNKDMAEGRVPVSLGPDCAYSRLPASYFVYRGWQHCCCSSLWLERCIQGNCKQRS